MKIGIYHHTFMHGSGIDNVLYEVAKRLSKNHEVEINTFFTDRVDTNLKINLLSSASSKSVFNAYNPATAIKTIKSVKKYDIVFTCMYPMNWLVSKGRILYGKKHKHIAFFWGAPPMNIVEGVCEKLYHKFLHFTEIIVPRFGVDRSIVPNEFIKKWNHISNPTVLPMHGVDLVRFNQKNVDKKRVTSILKKNNLPKDAKIIFTVGRVVPYKGIDLLINSLKKIRETKNNTYLLVAGSLWNKEYLIKLENIKDDHTILLGLVPEEDLSAYYFICDVYVSASKWEGQLNAEALAMGKPYVAFDTTSHKYTIENSLNGFLVKPYDTLEFAERIIELLKNPTLSKKIGINASRWAQKHSDYDLISQKLEQIFLEEKIQK